MQKVAARPGDWKCQSRLCQAHNFASKTKCFKCGNPKPGTSGGREGDWKCTACDVNNFAGKLACFKCGKQKPPPPKVVAGAGAAAADGDGPPNKKKKKKQKFENTGVYFENLPRGQLLFDVQQAVREACMPFGTLRKVNAYRSLDDENLSQGDALAVFTSGEEADAACAGLRSHPVFRVTRAKFEPKAKKPAAGDETDERPVGSGGGGGGGGGGAAVTAAAAAGSGYAAAAASAVAPPVVAPPLSVEQSSSSDTVFISEVFDVFAETSKEEAELKRRCATFGEIARWCVVSAARA